MDLTRPINAYSNTEPVILEQFCETIIDQRPIGLHVVVDSVSCRGVLGLYVQNLLETIDPDNRRFPTMEYEVQRTM
mgnify:CR=1 FL=1